MPKVKTDHGDPIKELEMEYFASGDPSNFAESMFKFLQKQESQSGQAGLLETSMACDAS